MTAGEPYPQAGFEFAPTTPAECNRHMMETFEPALVSIAAGIERRYLGEEYGIVSGGSPASFTLTSVTEAVRNPELIGSGATGETPGEASSEAGPPPPDNGIEAARRTFLEAILDHGQELEITEELPSPYDQEGWQIRENPDGSPVAFFSDRTDQGRRLRIVNLDTLFDCDPEFVRQQIRDYHVARAAQSLAHHIQAGPEYHELGAAVLPDVLKDIAALPPDEQQEAGIDALILAQYVSQLPGGASDQLRAFRQALMLSGIEKDTYDALDHMARCGTQPESVHVTARVLQGLYAGLAEMGFSTALAEGMSEERARLLEAPYGILPKYQQLTEASLLRAAEEERARASFVESVRLIRTPEELLAALRLSWPETYAQYTRLKVHLEEERGGVQLDTLLGDVARRIRLGTREISREAVLQELQSQLGFALGRDFQFEGVAPPHQYDPSVSFANLQIETALLLLVSKHAQTEIAERRNEPPAFGEVRYDAVVGYRAMEAQLEERYRETAEGTETYLRHYRGGFPAAESFRQDLALTDQDVEWLSILVNEENEPDPVDTRLFGLVFHALVLQRKELINIHSAGFGKFLRGVLAAGGELSEARAEALRRLAL